MDMFLQNQTAFGRVDRKPITNGDIAAKAQTALNEIKSQLEGLQHPMEGLGASPFPNAAKQNEDCISCRNLRIK